MSQIKHITLPPIHETFLEWDCNPLMHSRRGDGKIYFVYWFNVEHLVDFYAVVEVTEERLQEFADNKRPIRAMFMDPTTLEWANPIYVYTEYPWDDRKAVIAWELLDRKELFALMPGADVFLMESKNDGKAECEAPQSDVQELPVSGSGSD